jgi:SAM-dependent methyltransferase
MKKTGEGGFGGTYESLYSGAGKGTTWAFPEGFHENPRAAAVLDVRKKFDHAVSVLDIGCGKGVNTGWIARSGDGSTWFGVDVVNKEKIGLALPPDDEHFVFAEGNFLDENFLKSHPDFAEPKDIIVDQGAILLELEDEKQLREYLGTLYASLKDDGIFLALFMQGKHGTIHFPDGRKRVLWEPKDLAQPPFSDYFTVENLKEPFIHGYSMIPEDPSRPDIKNPLGAKTGDAMQITVFQIQFRKKG